MKNKKTITTLVLLTFLVAAIILYVKVQNSKNLILQNDNLISKLQTFNNVKNSTSSKKEIMALKKLTNFKWDRLYIFPPYSDPNKSSGSKGFDWVDSIKTNIYTDDGITLLVFVLDNKIVSYINYPRNKGDFTQLSKKHENGITPDYANFVIEYEDGWPNIIDSK